MRNYELGFCMYVCINMMYLYLILSKIFEFPLKQNFQYMHGIISYIAIKVYLLPTILPCSLYTSKPPDIHIFGKCK